MTESTETPAEHHLQANSAIDKALQTHVTFALPGPMDSRALRLDILREGLLPKNLWANASFYGHRGSLNIVALAPDDGALETHAPDIGLWLAERTGHHVPMRASQREVAVEFTGKPTEHLWGPVVLAKAGKNWAQAEDPKWVRDKLERRLEADLAVAAQTWGVAIGGKAPAIAGTGRNMPITMNVATTDKPITVMCAVGVKIRWDVNLSGVWAIGPMNGAGFGRLYNDIEALPSAMRRMAAGKHVPTTLAEQLEALL